MTLDLDKLEALDKAAGSEQWIASVRPDGTAHVYKPNRGPLRMIVPVAEVDPEYAPLIAAMRNALPALLQAARERDEAVRLLRWWNDGSSIDNVAEHAEEVAAFLARVSR